MQGLIFVLGKFLSGFMLIRKFIPVGMAIITALIKVATSVYEAIVQGDPIIFFKALGEVTFLAEFRIHEIVVMAINNDPGYTAVVFMELLGSCFLVYFMLKMLAKFVAFVGPGVAGDPGLGEWLLGGAGLFLIEWVYGVVHAGITMGFTWEIFYAFIPLVHGIGFALWHLGPVLGNINWVSWNDATQFAGQSFNITNVTAEIPEVTVNNVSIS